MQYDFSVVALHRPLAGRQHGLPDGLSRFPLEGDSIYGEHEQELLGSVVGSSGEAARSRKEFEALEEFINGYRGIQSRTRQRTCR